MIEINANNNTTLEFALNIENTTQPPKNVRLILPIKEGLNLSINGTVIEKSVLVTIPPIDNIVEGTEIKGAHLEVVLNEQGQDVLFEVAQETVKIIRPIKIAANLNSTQVSQPEKLAGPITVSATVSNVTNVEEQSQPDVPKPTGPIWDRVKKSKHQSSSEFGEFGDSEF